MKTRCYFQTPGVGYFRTRCTEPLQASNDSASHLIQAPITGINLLGSDGFKLSDSKLNFKIESY